MPDEIRICRICAKPIPDDAHHAAQTCSHECQRELFYQTHRAGNKRYREKFTRKAQR